MKDTVHISDSVSVRVESNHLFYSNRDRVGNLLRKQDFDQNDMIDTFVALHIVLELGINNVFRQIIEPTLKKQLDIHVMIENLDNINFIDKTIMFIYYSKFNFDDVEKATHYHSIINKLKSFSEMRNKILHGHSISEISDGGNNSRSNLKKKLNQDKLSKQLEDFKFIIDGLCYYLDSLETTWAEAGIAQLKKAYLS